MRLEKVLVANDSNYGLVLALQKALLLTAKTGAEVEVARVVWDALEEESATNADVAAMIERIVDTEQRRLDESLSEFGDRLRNASARVIWGKRADEEMIEEARREGADLLVKPVGEHHGLLDYLVTPLDWKVIRDAPCPVLVSKSRPWQFGAPVLVAVDIADAKHADLTLEILRTADAVRETLGVELHVMTAYPDLGQSVNDYQVAMDYVGIKEDMRRARADALDRALVPLSHPAVAHVVEGKPSKVIRALASEIGADLVVMGSAGRHHLGKLVLGNTAEDILSKVESDILVVK